MGSDAPDRAGSGWQIQAEGATWIGADILGFLVLVC